jgi:hypothetical protein
MARNQEKAQSMLYRFREAMLIESGQKRHPKDRRPLLPSACNSLPIAETARKDVLKEVNRLIGRIQDPQLEPAQLRTLNTDINERIREVRTWDERITQLGGLGRRSQRRIEELEAAAIRATELDAQDQGQGELVSIGGVYYFGRARDLPEVQEALAARRAARQEAFEAVTLRSKLATLQAQVNEDYYSAGAEEDEEEEFHGLMARGDARLGRLLTHDLLTDRPFKEDAHNVSSGNGTSIDADPYALNTEPLAVPTQQEVEAFLIEMRKAALLARYT